MEVLDLEKNALLNLINHEPQFDNFLYAKDSYEAKYWLLIDKRKCSGLKYLNDSKSFIIYSNYMDYTYKNIHEHNPN